MIALRLLLFYIVVLATNKFGFQIGEKILNNCKYIIVNTKLYSFKSYYNTFNLSYRISNLDKTITNYFIFTII